MLCIAPELLFSIQLECLDIGEGEVSTLEKGEGGWCKGLTLSKGGGRKK